MDHTYSDRSHLCWLRNVNHFIKCLAGWFVTNKKIIALSIVKICRKVLSKRMAICYGGWSVRRIPAICHVRNESWWIQIIHLNAILVVSFASDQIVSFMITTIFNNLKNHFEHYGMDGYHGSPNGACEMFDIYCIWKSVACKIFSEFCREHCLNSQSFKLPDWKHHVLGTTTT